MFARLKALKNLDFSESVERNAVSVVEGVQLTSFDSDLSYSITFGNKVLAFIFGIFREK